MRITGKNLRQLIREELLNESVREGNAYKRLVDQFPHLENVIGIIADHKKAGAALTKWLFSRFVEGSAEELHQIEDAIVPIRNLADSFEKIESKWRSGPEFKKAVSKFFKMPEWEKENSILAVIPFMTSDQIDKLPGLAGREKSSFEIDVSEEEMESDRVGKVGAWNLWMPTTRERSCAIAQYDPVSLEPRTTWCTARMAGSNLFYNYTGRPGVDMTLFYIIRDDPERDDDWLSVGFVNGKPELEGKSGGISVDRANVGLTEARLKSVLGSDYHKIMSVLSEKNRALGGKHPARQKIIDAAKSLEGFNHIMKGLSKTDAMDMRELIAQEEEISPDVLDELANTKTDNEYFLAFIAKNPNTPPAALARMAQERGQYIQEWVARHPNAPPETLLNLSKKSEFFEYNIRYGVARNENTPYAALKTLARDEHENIRSLVAMRKDLPEDLMDLLADDREPGVKTTVAANESAPDYVLERLALDGNQNVRMLVAANRGASPKALKRLARDRVQDVQIAVAKNPNTPNEELERLATDLDDYIRKPAEITLKRKLSGMAAGRDAQKTVAESLLRRIVREELLSEAMMTPVQADRKGITFKAVVSEDTIEITAVRGDEEMGALHAKPTLRPCLDAWAITDVAWSSIDGLGPLMYDLMIDLVNPRPLTSDRSSVSFAAKNVWDYYMRKRSDIEWAQLDNPEDELTPGVEDDNCWQNSAIMWSREGQPWNSLSVSKAYRRVGGGTPVLDALDDLGIIEIE